MSRSPFATLTNGLRRTFAVHYSAVIGVEQSGEGAIIMVRVGNTKENYQLMTPFDEVMRELDRARRAEIMSFGE